MMAAKRLELRGEKVDGVLIIPLPGPTIPYGEIEHVGDMLIKAAQEHPGSSMILDFSQVELIPSAVIARLIGLHRTVTEAGGVLVLCSVVPRVVETLEITNLLKVFQILPDREEALRSLQS